MFFFILNQATLDTALPAGTVLLDFLRLQCRLTGAKEGCREGDCGTCLILLGEMEGGGIHYRPVNACLLPLGEAAGRHVVSIEGLNDVALTPLQRILVDEGAVQCGYCTPGIVLALTAFLLNSPILTEEQGVLAVSGNLCRCTGYMAIKRAIRRLCNEFVDLNRIPPQDRIAALVEQRLLPSYFLRIPERLGQLPQHRQAVGAQTVRVAGGTDLFVQKPEPLVEAELEFLLRRPELIGIRIEQGRCRIGSATTVEELRLSPCLKHFLPNIDKDLRLFCSTPVRQRATLAGNLVNASPSGDLIIMFLALNATLGFADGQTRRTLSLRDFYRGYKELAKTPAELIEWVSFPLPRNASFNYEKVSKRAHLDIASVNSAVQIQVTEGVITDIHLSAGGVAPIPLNLSATADYLRGKPLAAQHLREAAEVAQQEISPISDVRGSAEYKRMLLRRLLFSHFLKLFPDAIRGEALL